MLHSYTYHWALVSVSYILILLLLPSATWGRTDPPLAGARSWGMAACSVTLTDAWSSRNNPAGLATLQTRTALATYDRPFGMKGLQTMGVGYVHPLKTGVASMTLSRFGDELYQIHTLGLAYGRVWEKLQTGTRLTYQQTGIQEIAVWHTFAIEAGIVAPLIPKQLFLGTRLYLPLARPHSPTHPTPYMQAGIAYRVVSSLLLVAEAEKTTLYPTTIRLGAEYEVVRNLFLRTGIHTQPHLYTFGVGIHPARLHLDYALRTHPILGLSHQVSLEIPFRKKHFSSTPATS